MAGIGDLVYGLSYGVRAFAARMLIKSVAMPYFSQWLASNWAAPTFRQIVGEGVRTNAAVFACSTALTNGFCEPPLTLYEESPGGDAILVQEIGRASWRERV